MSANGPFLDADLMTQTDVELQSCRQRGPVRYLELDIFTDCLLFFGV